MNSEMRYEKQVDKSNYEFGRYMSKERWCRIWHQLDEIKKLNPENILEVGPGAGVFKATAAMFGMKVETMDFDPDLKPDHVASATAMPFRANTYDAVCAFQMLEHLPYDASLQAFAEMVRVSRRFVVISLPDARRVWRYRLYIPKKGAVELLVPRPQIRAPNHEFNGEHYWEVNKRLHPLKRIVDDFTAHISLVKTYRVPEIPYHRFFVFQH